MIRDRIFHLLSRNPSGLSAAAVCDELGDMPGNQCHICIEALLLLSPEVVYDNARFRLTARNREHRILDALESYATRTEKKIFRLSAALEDFPPEEMPTADELVKLLETGGQRFQLLPNSMIKRN